MSGPLISRSPDLARLAEAGYELEIRDGCILVHNVPYVTPAGTVAYGTLISPLELAGDGTAKPSTHVASFRGEKPCDKDGQPLTKLINNSGEHEVAPGVKADHYFSQKKLQGYVDYYEKITTYVALLENHAQAINSEVTARTYGPVIDASGASVFKYMDTNTSRAGLGAATAKLEVGKVAIIGLGGTGSYVLDQLAKTPIQEIHLFDDDVFLTHTAFRSPGAPSLEQLRAQPMKVDHYTQTYSHMRDGIVPHAYRVDESTIDELGEIDFVFICIDDGPSRKVIANYLHERGKLFIDVGMGAHERDGSIGGQVRVTTSTPAKRDHVDSRLPYGKAPDDDYRNIQIADMNALNGLLAVIRWKKIVGFYDDLEHEHNTIYLIDGNTLINEDNHE
jgi:molybdopterin/thiamine biosynthesis adenylyltransferase